MSSLSVVAVLRSFNRSYTQRIGVLEQSFLGSGRSLAASRLLYEIGPTGTSAGVLRDRLGLDSGYLSRLLRELEGDGLITVVPDPDDRRRRLIDLTASGIAAWESLDAASDALATALVSPLTDTQRARLAEAITEADRLLRAATARFAVTDPEATESITALTRYFAELDVRFPGGFDPGDALTADAERLRRPEGVFVVAWIDADVVACGGLQRLAPDIAEVKRMWVDPSHRGLGLGRRLLDVLEAQAAEAGYRTIVLDTNTELTEAIALYHSAGYRQRDPYNDNPYARAWFEKDLTTSIR